MHEIADQMLKTHLQIITLQEIKWKGSHKIKKDKYSLYYSCSQQNAEQLGTGFMVKRETINSVALVHKQTMRPSGRRLSAKLVLTFADRGCCVVSAMDPHGRILGFLDRERNNKELLFHSNHTMRRSVNSD
jgi:exonuclease III